MVHYVDLAETKGVVLMVGEYNNDVLVSLKEIYFTIANRVDKSLIIPCRSSETH